MKRIIYILVITTVVGVIIGAPFKNHFLAEAQFLWYGQISWGQPYGWGRYGYGVQIIPLAWFPQTGSTTYTPYITIDSRFIPPEAASGMLSGSGFGYAGSSNEPAPIGTVPPPFEKPVGVFIGDILFPPGYVFNWPAPPNIPELPPGEPGELRGGRIDSSIGYGPPPSTWLPSGR